MFEALWVGLVQVVQWPSIGFLGLGILIGLYLGAVPGLGGMVGLAILLPFTFDMDPIPAFALLLGMYAVTTTSDTLASVLLGVPGTAASQATILDGYPLARKGEAARAFGAAFTASAVGGVLGAAVLGLSLPIVRPLILSFAAPEFFMLGVLGLTMVGALSGSSIQKGLVGALLGLLASTVGLSSQGGMARYNFDIPYLMEGLPLVPVVLGFFALPELVELAIRNTAIAGEREAGAPRVGIGAGIRDALRHPWLILRCSAIGMYIGMLPGVGGAIVDWVAYGHAVQSARDKSQFGNGDIRGVLAPEAANNAMKGPALLPTLAFGIPGSAAMALLLGAFLIQGLTPGPEMLGAKLHVTFSMMWTFAIANIVGAGLLMLWSGQVAKVTFIRGNLLVPAIILFVFMGSWMSGNQMGDWYMLMGFGVLGFAMKVGGWPRPPFVLGFILGPIMENSFDLSVQIFGWRWLIDRPLALVILLLAVAALAYAIVRQVRGRRRGAGPVVSDAGGGTDRRVSLALGGLILAIFAVAIVPPLSWSSDAALFPLSTAPLGAALTAIALASEVFRRGGAPAESPIAGLEGRTAAIFLWLLAVVGLTLIFSQLIALPLITVLFLRFWARESWAMAIGQAVVLGGFLYLMFEQTVNVLWHRGLLFG